MKYVIFDWIYITLLQLYVTIVELSINCNNTVFFNKFMDPAVLVKLAGLIA